jgi:hypothetical protein
VPKKPACRQRLAIDGLAVVVIVINEVTPISAQPTPSREVA